VFFWNLNREVVIVVMLILITLSLYYWLLNKLNQLWGKKLVFRFRWRLPISHGFRQCWMSLMYRAPADTGFARAASPAIRFCRCFSPPRTTTFRRCPPHRPTPWILASRHLGGRRVQPHSLNRRSSAQGCRPPGVSCRPTRPSWPPCRSAASWFYGACRRSVRSQSPADLQNLHGSTRRLCRRSQTLRGCPHYFLGLYTDLSMWFYTVFTFVYHAGHMSNFFQMQGEGARNIHVLLISQEMLKAGLVIVITVNFFVV